MCDRYFINLKETPTSPKGLQIPVPGWLHGILQLRLSTETSNRLATKATQIILFTQIFCNFAI